MHLSKFFPPTPMQAKEGVLRGLEKKMAPGRVWCLENVLNKERDNQMEKGGD